MGTGARSQNRIRQLGGRRQYDNLETKESGPLLTRQLDQVTDKINDMVRIRALPVPTGMTANGFSGGVQLRWDDLDDLLKPSLAGARVWRAQLAIDDHTEFNENSNKRILADLVKTTFYTDLTADSEIEFIYWVQHINQDGLASDPAGGKKATKTSYNVCPIDVDDASPLAIDVSTSSYFRVLFVHTTGGGTRELQLSGGKCGQKIILEVKQSASGSDLLTYDAKVGFGTDIPNGTLSTTANKKDFLGFIYNEDDDKYYLVAFVKGY